MPTERKDMRRRERSRLNRLARVTAAADDVQRMYAAWNFWRATLKRLPLDQRAAHRDRIADLLVNDALNQMDTQRHAPWEVAA